jgi:hypothetical protein
MAPGRPAEASWKPKRRQTLFGELCEPVCAPGHFLKQVTTGRPFPSASRPRLKRAESALWASPFLPARASANEGYRCALLPPSDRMARRDLFPD